VALDTEPNVMSPWPEDKIIFLPRVAGANLTLHRVAGHSDLAPGSFGVLEPSAQAPAADPVADLILVPGLGFDCSGARLGRGRGYYDRLLSGFQGLRAGLCFNESLCRKFRPRRTTSAWIF
jgi:5-formyltetrahydrofolate cyclo-ligase